METEHRNLVIILGDQLTDRLSAFDGFDKGQDLVWMAEVARESTKVWSSKQRITLFLSAMRHFASELEARGIRIHYHSLGEDPEYETIGGALENYLDHNAPEKVILTHPGEYRILEEIKRTCIKRSIRLEIREDNSFLCTVDEFVRFSTGRKQLRMEHFYRQMRRKYSVLMDDNQPSCGKWNFDSSNRKSFGKAGPPRISPRLQFAPDRITREVIQLVHVRFASHPGNLDNFCWPTCRSEALLAQDDFMRNHLAEFGPHQDAMWTSEPYLSHSLLASSLNLKLLHPEEVIEAAESAFKKELAPIESVEGFIRQILGWREYVRGIYWMLMPDYLERNHLNATLPLPRFYWTGETDLHCIREVVQQTFRNGYAHHIQRLMVTGLYALLLGVEPKQVHEWYLAAYVDAVEWVELPNTLGMSQYADGGVMASKPYAATGKYVKRMSNYCDNCRFDPDKRTGKDACPFTLLYWDFLSRNSSVLKGNQRMSLQMRNLDNISPGELQEIRTQAAEIKTAQCRNPENWYTESDER